MDLTVCTRAELDREIGAGNRFIRGILAESIPLYARPEPVVASGEPARGIRRARPRPRLAGMKLVPEKARKLPSGEPASDLPGARRSRRDGAGAGAGPTGRPEPRACDAPHRSARATNPSGRLSPRGELAAATGGEQLPEGRAPACAERDRYIPVKAPSAAMARNARSYAATVRSRSSSEWTAEIHPWFGEQSTPLLRSAQRRR